MRTFQYFYSIIDKASGKEIFSDINDLKLLQPYLSESLFQFMDMESKIERLYATKLEDENIICNIRRELIETQSTF